MSDFMTCWQALAICEATGSDPAEEYGAELATQAQNIVSATLYARGKDTPGKTWWHAEAQHSAIYRALRIDPKEDGAVFAAEAFRLYRSPEGVRILAAFPAPRILGPFDEDWLGIEAVLSWDPVTNTAEVLAQPGPELIAAVDHGATFLTVYCDPFAFLRSLAEERARWSCQRSAGFRAWQHKPEEPRFYPGMMLIGAPDAVRWPRHLMPETVHCVGLDPKALNRALIKQAGVPHVVPSHLRRAA